MKKIILLCGLLAAICLPASATMQAREKLIVDGDTLRMASLPLDAYLKSRNMTPDDIPELKGKLSTGLWRGYLGTWEIAEGKLFLVRLESSAREPVDLAALFGKKHKNGKVPADWVTLDLYAQYGDQLIEDPFFYSQRWIYEKEKKVVVREGKVISMEDYDTLNGGHDPDMVRLWNGYGIDSDRVVRALEYIVMDGFQWNDRMTESMVIVVWYGIKEDFSHQVRGEAQLAVEGYEKMKKELPAASGALPIHEKSLARMKAIAEKPGYDAYVEEIGRVLQPVKVESFIFCGKPAYYTGHQVRLYFDAATKQISRVMTSRQSPGEIL